ncbi:vesicle transport protein SFT2C [Pteronotus mesoamericanus]|uniref:vesicle transport protein SFT2C n=1 Tax=Pteronotus mesoamericanus TaxID=1884717 RepID=UPI0023EB8AE9|nr:vesicle transport protein SFT2C [Pteronotus parnellii mesoamericanus]
MADVHRELQEYLAQGKAGGRADTEPLLVPEKAEETEAGDRTAVAWLGLRWKSARSSAGPEAGTACLPNVTRTQRLAASGICLLLATLCFGLAALYAPALLLHARKFGILWSLGSALALAGGTILRGNAAYTGLLRCEEAPSRAALLYVAALGATLYAALALRSTLLTALGACAQVAALLAALIELLPRGASAALRLVLGRTGLGAGLSKVLPV